MRKDFLLAAAVACLVMADGFSTPVRAESIVPGSLEELARFHKHPTENKMVVDGFLWVEAEDFSDYGKWRLDTQFVHKMGSAYLLAGGIGDPIGTASTQIQVPEAGTWRVWVRTRNWLKGFAPGRFTVAVDGHRSGNVLGAGEPEVWAWESAGDFDLSAEAVSLELIDLSGAFARCDALILTRDLGYVPPDDLFACEQERVRLSGLSQAVSDEGCFDVVVVGAGSSGMGAAIAAARTGARTALVHDRPVLGGNASSELGVIIVGASIHLPHARESGLIEEAGLIRAKRGFPKMSEAFHIQAVGESNLTVFNNRRVIGVEKDGAGEIGAVNAVDTLTLGKSRVRGRLFIDCTGDGWVGYYAGAEYRFGREARAEFEEPSAPEWADNITMSGTIMGGLTVAFRSEKQAQRVVYTPPDWALELPEELGRNIRSISGGEWWMEHPGVFDDLEDPERARDELIRITFAYWGYLKNDFELKDELTWNYALTYVPHMDARRETRRLVGDYVFKEQDARAGRMFPDRISYGGWPVDVHHPRGILSGKEGPYMRVTHPIVPIYSIPYRTIYSTNIPNLFFAGRCMSTTHMGLGTLRVQGTLSTVGQAAGTAAALCVQHGVLPREFGQQHIEELQQQLLKNDQYIPNVVNEDPADLARQATVTASSAIRNRTRSPLVEIRGAHPLNMCRAVMVPRGTTEHLETVELYLVSNNEIPVDVQLHVRGSDKPGEFLSSKDIAVAQATLSAKGRSYVSFAVDCDLVQPYIWFWLPNVAGVEWGLVKNREAGVFRAYRTGAGWQAVQGEQYAFSSEPSLRLVTEDFSPEKVIDGVARTVGENSHMWQSDPGQFMPQWLTLDFGEVVSINTVQLTFDTDQNRRHPAEPVSKFCVKDYRVEVLNPTGRWQEVVAVTDNFLRHRVHVFPAVTASKMRVTVDATNGDPSARIFEIRAYGD